MSTQTKSRQNAEAKFASKQLKAQEARHAYSDYEASARAIDEKTRRLRELRLAKEAADAAEPAPNPPKAKKRTAAPKRVRRP